MRERLIQNKLLGRTPRAKQFVATTVDYEREGGARLRPAGDIVRSEARHRGRRG
jgi:hypothetical protein